MNKKSVLLSQISSCQKADGWFVAFDNAVKGLSNEQANWIPEKGSNSIREIVNHILFWNDRCLNTFKGLPNHKMEGDNDSTFQNQGNIDWNETVARFQSTMDDWYNTINRAEDDLLDKAAGENTTDSWAAVIGNMINHAAYHIGQIVFIRKLQGSWDPNQGVN
ncbi:DinB family protein [Peribacillus sp. SCS-155]|uniref:DinB family protein n=1 Tax=Peribacillus sedimenti TaxID=3115297 RepID=UPI003905D98D